MIRDSLIEVLKDYRSYHNLSQRELAKKANLDHAVISRIENGKIQRPDIITLLRLNSLLNMDFIKLLSISNYERKDIENLYLEMNNIIFRKK